MKRALMGMSAALLAASSPSTSAPQPPDFSGIWGRNTFDFEPTDTGPRPIRNLERLASGSSDPTRPVGDDSNPILKPEAAAIVKDRAEKAKRGITFPYQIGRAHV